jgi:UDP-glucose 4-epimerase
MKIYITGCAGFLGSHLADEFIRLGHKVSGIDNLIGGYLKNVPPKVNFTLGDCGDLALMERELEGIDVVYHCACTAHEGLSVFSPSFITSNTYGNSISVISAAVQNKVKRFVYCSSMARYGAIQIPFTEEMVCKPQDPYGIAKLAVENTLRILGEVHGMEYVIAVPHNIIGPRQKYDDPFRNVVSIMINRMLRGEAPIIYGNGTQKRSFSFISDVVSPLVKMATAPVSGEVINIGPDDLFTSINELARVISPKKPIYHKDRPQEVKLAMCSNAKARKLLDYNPQKSLKDGIIEMIEWIREAGPKEFEYNLPIEIINDKTPVTWTKKLI